MDVGRAGGSDRMGRVTDWEGCGNRMVLYVCGASVRVSYCGDPGEKSYAHVVGSRRRRGWGWGLRGGAGVEGWIEEWGRTWM